jgi:hypothetical protein
VTDTWDDDDRAIARALGADAPAGGATADVDAVADYETVLGFLPFAEVEPPPDLEDRVVTAALARRPAAARAIDTKRAVTEPGRGHVSRRWIGAAAAAVVAAAIIVVLVAGRTPSVPGSPAGRIAPAAATGDAAQVIAAPDTRRGVLRTPAGAAGGAVALGAQGSGYLTGLELAPRGSPYWLWLDTGPSPVRVGSLPDAATVHFVVRGDVDSVRGVIISPTPDAPDPVSLRGPLSS